MLVTTKLDEVGKAAALLVGFQKEKRVKLTRIGVIAADNGGKGTSGKHRCIGIFGSRIIHIIGVFGGSNVWIIAMMQQARHHSGENAERNKSGRKGDKKVAHIRHFGQIEALLGFFHVFARFIRRSCGRTVGRIRACGLRSFWRLIQRNHLFGIAQKLCAVFGFIVFFHGNYKRRVGRVDKVKMRDAELFLVVAG